METESLSDRIFANHVKQMQEFADQLNKGYDKFHEKLQPKFKMENSGTIRGVKDAWHIEEINAISNFCAKRDLKYFFMYTYPEQNCEAIYIGARLGQKPSITPKF